MGGTNKMSHKINKELIISLYNQRQSGFPNVGLRQNGVRIYKDGSHIRAVMGFAIPGWDDYGQLKGELEGVHLSGASAPPMSELSFVCNKSDRAIDSDVINLAYTAGSCDLARYQWPDRMEWFFKPSCFAAFRDFGMRLDDDTINNDGYRSGNNHGLFPHQLYSDFDTTDCYQHIYEFCGCKTIKVKK